METKIKNLLARLAFFAEDGMAEPPIVAIAKDADALLKEMCLPKPEKQPLPVTRDDVYETLYGLKISTRHQCMEAADKIVALFAAKHQAEPVARIKTVGGYPDDSRHELELLVKHGQLSDGQLLYAARPPAVAVPDGYALVPAVATDHMTWVGQSMRYDREISIGAIYAAMLAAAPQGAVAATLPPYNVFSDDDGDSWREHPADADFVEGLQLGDEFELLAGWRPVRVTFRVTKVPDDENDDYEVEEVTAPAAAQEGGA